LRKFKKVPFVAVSTRRKASPTDPSTWSTFDAAFMAYKYDLTLDGIGFVLHGDGLVGIDLDHCFEGDHRLKPWARVIVDAVPGHWERSPSGEGVRGLCRAKLRPGRRRRSVAGGSVEIYDDGRFLSVTGVAL
jgi:primase-polymerase (primpol)-like protein